MKLYSCSNRPQDNIAEFGKNWSTISDKLIRLSAKLTEFYGGDVFYLLRDFESHIEGESLYDYVIFFRECGIDWNRREDVEQMGKCDYPFDSAVQTWQLLYRPDSGDDYDPKMVLKRISLV